VHVQRAAFIAQAPEFRARIAQAMAARFPEDPAAPTPPVEKQIFGGFYSNADKTLLAEFQRADWRRRQEIVAALSDARLRQLGRRLVAFNAPELLSTEEHAQFQAWLEGRWTAEEAPETEWMTIARSQRVLAELQGSRACDAALVREIDAYLRQFGSLMV